MVRVREAVIVQLNYPNETKQVMVRSDFKVSDTCPPYVATEDYMILDLTCKHTQK